MSESGIQSRALGDILDRFQSTDDILRNQVIPALQSQTDAINNLTQLMGTGGAQGNTESPLQPGATAVEQGVRNAFIGDFLPFPFSYGDHLLPATGSDTPVKIDFRTGEVDVPGVGNFKPEATQTLKDIDERNSVSGSVFVDAPITLTLRNDVKRITGKVHPGGIGFVSWQNNQVASLEITSAVPFTVGGTVSTGLQAPILPNPVGVSVERYGKIEAATASAVPVPFIPFGQEGQITDNYKANTIQAAINNFGSPLLFTNGNVSQVSFIIHNDGPGSVDYNVIGFDKTGGTEVADSDIMNTTDKTSFNTLAAGSTDVLESGLPLGVREVQVKETNQGSPGTVDVQFLGFSPEVR